MGGNNVALTTVFRRGAMTATADDYLRLLGVPISTEPDAESLALLQERHLRTVPFENLSIHSGEPIVLKQQALWEKVITRRRGGFCFELNGSFAGLLTAIGFRVTLLSAQVYTGGGDLGPPQDHLALRVDLDEPWLVDVGFGKFTRHPVRLDSRAPQDDDEGEVQVVAAEHGDLDVILAGRPNYRLDLKPRRLDDFTAMAWYHSNSPDSPFTQHVSCSLATPEGRVTVSDNRLITTVGDDRTETELADDEVVAAYQRHFGISLTEAPAVKPDP